MQLGAGQVIRGWDEGVAKVRLTMDLCICTDRNVFITDTICVHLGDDVIQMSLGQVAKLTLSHEYAYGERGYPPVIPPKATLVFEVELLGFN